MNRNCIVTAGIGSWHPRGVERLKESLIKTNFNGDIIPFIDKYPPDCPTHQEIPYAFKPYAFDYARKQGYKNVLWVDSSAWAIDNIDLLFMIIRGRGHFMEDSGHNVGTWSSDSCLTNFSLTRDYAMHIQMFIAGIFGLNFEEEFGNRFLDMWIANLDQFKGPWNNNNKEISNDYRCHGHRHDMTVGSILAHQMKLEYYPNNTFMAYYEWYQKYKDDPNFDTSKIKFLLQGM